MSKGFWAIIAAVVLIFLGIVVFGGKDKAGAPSSKGGNSSQLSQHVQGSGTTGVTLVEYGDFQCPYCLQYYPTVQQVVAEYGDKIKFQFRHFPLVQLHKNAFAASRSAEAAGKQGKFWEMYDKLYDSNNHSVWAESSDAVPYFEQYAKDLGLDMTKYKADFGSSVVNDTINADMAEGNKLGITGTPTFFINGKQTQIANSPEAFKKVIDAEIAKQSKQSN